MCVCSWALRHPLVNTYILDSVLASYAVLLDLTPLAAGKVKRKHQVINGNRGAPLSMGFSAGSGELGGPHCTHHIRTELERPYCGVKDAVQCDTFGDII